MARWIHYIGEFSGKAGSWASLLLLILIVANVLLRFIFNQSYNVLLETEWHLFAMIFLCGGSYNLLHDKHIRVDFFYADFSEITKIRINLFFHILLLLPWTWVGMVTCFQYASNSFFMREGSPNPGGLPALYPIKFLIVLSFFFLMLQGIGDILKNIREIRASWKS